MTGDKGHLGGGPAVGDWYAGVAGRGNGAGHARHHLKGQASLPQGAGFLAAAAEYIGIASLEAGDGLAGCSKVAEQLANILLAHGVVAALFTHIDAFGR
jgi:hypothetical protein